MELLVVITIIAILVSLTLAAGTKVVSVGKERGTQWALQTLDTSLGEYIQANGSIPPPTVRDPLNANRRVPIVDGRVGNGSNGNAPLANGTGESYGDLKKMDSTAWYIYQLQSEGSSALAAVHQIDARLRKTGIVDTAAATSNESQTGTRTTQILDVWGNPIRYVHPRFAGVHGQGWNSEQLNNVLGNAPSGTQYGFDSAALLTFSRDVPPSVLPAGKRTIDYKRDADGGAPPNRRPYFYSCGPDGDPSTIDDNVYTIRPVFPR